MRSPAVGNPKRGTKAVSTMMNVKVPTRIAEAVDQLARRHGVSKTDVIVALLNQGLGVAARRIDGHRRK